MCFNCVLKGVFVVVYCVWYVLCCCLHGVIKHDDDDDIQQHFDELNSQTGIVIVTVFLHLLGRTVDRVQLLEASAMETERQPLDPADSHCSFSVNTSPALIYKVQRLAFSVLKTENTT